MQQSNNLLDHNNDNKELTLEQRKEICETKKKENIKQQNHYKESLKEENKIFSSFSFNIDTTNAPDDIKTKFGKIFQKVPSESNVFLPAFQKVPSKSNVFLPALQPEYKINDNNYEEAMDVYKFLKGQDSFKLYKAENELIREINNYRQMKLKQLKIQEKMYNEEINNLDEAIKINKEARQILHSDKIYEEILKLTKKVNQLEEKEKQNKQEKKEQQEGNDKNAIQNTNDNVNEKEQNIGNIKNDSNIKTENSLINEEKKEGNESINVNDQNNDEKEKNNENDKEKNNNEDIEANIKNDNDKKEKVQESSLEDNSREEHNNSELNGENQNNNIQESNDIDKLNKTNNKEENVEKENEENKEENEEKKNDSSNDNGNNDSNNDLDNEDESMKSKKNETNVIKNNEEENKEQSRSSSNSNSSDSNSANNENKEKSEDSKNITANIEEKNESKLISLDDNDFGKEKNEKNNQNIKDNSIIFDVKEIEKQGSFNVQTNNDDFLNQEGDEILNIHNDYNDKENEEDKAILINLSSVLQNEKSNDKKIIFDNSKKNNTIDMDNFMMNNDNDKQNESLKQRNSNLNQNNESNNQSQIQQNQDNNNTLNTNVQNNTGQDNKNLQTKVIKKDTKNKTNNTQIIKNYVQEVEKQQINQMLNNLNSNSQIPQANVIASKNKDNLVKKIVTNKQIEIKENPNFSENLKKEDKNIIDDSNLEKVNEQQKLEEQNNKSVEDSRLEEEFNDVEAGFEEQNLDDKQNNTNKKLTKPIKVQITPNGGKAKYDLTLSTNEELHDFLVTYYGNKNVKIAIESGSKFPGFTTKYVPTTVEDLANMHGFNVEQIKNEAELNKLNELNNMENIARLVSEKTGKNNEKILSAIEKANGITDENRDKIIEDGHKAVDELNGVPISKVAQIHRSPFDAFISSFNQLTDNSEKDKVIQDFANKIHCVYSDGRPVKNIGAIKKFFYDNYDLKQGAQLVSDFVNEHEKLLDSDRELYESHKSEFQEDIQQLNEDLGSIANIVTTLDSDTKENTKQIEKLMDLYKSSLEMDKKMHPFKNALTRIFTFGIRGYQSKRTKSYRKSLNALSGKILQNQIKSKVDVSDIKAETIQKQLRALKGSQMSMQEKGKMEGRYDNMNPDGVADVKASFTKLRGQRDFSSLKDKMLNISKVGNVKDGVPKSNATSVSSYPITRENSLVLN